MNKEYKLETLEVYQLAEEFSNKIWGVVNRWDFFQKDTVGKQLVRSADSISANIAEGYGRHFYADSIKFYYYSRGSLTETFSWVQKSKVRGLITDEELKLLSDEMSIIHSKLNGYISWLRTQKNNENK
jgi:four helix bundle protein